MSDGQDKSDDLIAELAKLMATGAPEPQKAGPKLVTLPDAPRDAPRPAAPTSIRIPGMDVPVMAQPAPRPAPAAPAPPSPAPAMSIRIPGQPFTAAPAPVSTPAAAAPMPVAPAPSVPPAATGASPAEPSGRSAFDFGALPPAPAIKPEPMANWREREIPKPTARPSSVQPVLPPALEPKPAEAPAARVEPAIAAPPPVKPEPPRMGTAKSDDGFAFDFGFAEKRPTLPEAEAARPAKPEPAAPAKPEPANDPIADLIAAELDAAEEDDAEAADEPVVAPPRRAAIAAPVARTPDPNPVRQPPSTFRPSIPGLSNRAFPDSDRFAVAPTFGAPKPASSPAPAPAPEPVADYSADADRDPMDEIESLIGEAVRVELSAEKPVAPQPQPAPVVPPLTTAFAPRRSVLRDSEPQIGGAEAAILAAAATAGAEVGRIDTVEADPASSYKRPRAQPEARGMMSGGLKQYVGMAVAGTLLLASGFGLYWVLGMGRAPDGEAPVVVADADPTKTVPAAVAPTEQQGSVVFNQLDPATAAQAPTEVIVPRDDSQSTSVADITRTVGGEGTPAVTDSELANRKVRTVTVRPDGTIVSGDDAVAGTEVLPVDRPNVPAIPGADVQPAEMLAAVPSTSDPIGAALNQPATLPESANALVATAYTIDPANLAPGLVAPVPMPRPADRSALSAGNGTLVAEAPAATGPIDLVPSAPVAVSQPVQTASVNAAAYVQVASPTSETDAQRAISDATARYGSLFGGNELFVQRTDLGTRGIRYRVRLPVASLQDATRICNSIKANGGDCFATTN